MSVIVPVYNVAPYLGECVDSILAQTHRDLDVILVDDGSRDESGALCDRYAAADARVRVVHQPNAGLSAARNAGLGLARGSHIAFVDGDDAVSPAFIEGLLGMDADVAQCAFCASATSLQSMPTITEALTPHDALERLQVDNAGTYTVVWNKLYRRCLFEGLRFPEGKQHEDEFITYRLLWAARSICVTSSPLYFYRQRPGSIMGMGITYKSLDAVEALEERALFYRERGEAMLAALTDATTCHRLREMMASIKSKMPSEAPRLRHVMWERYLALMRGSYLSISKKTRLTLQMISPTLHKTLASWRR